jgi:nucleoside-diphosphate-sugar epimerase
MSTILVTGGTGFVGSNLVRKLSLSKNKIHLLTRNSSNFWRIDDVKEKLDIHKVDIFDKKKLEIVIKKINPKIVFHLAAYGIKRSENDISKTLDTNIIGTHNLFSILSNQRVKRIVNVGSVFEYGQKLNNNGFLETDCLHPLTFYGITKAAQTNIANHFFKFRSLPVTTLRLFTPYGMFEEKGRLITDIMFAIIKNKKLKISSPKSVRDFVFIDDVIEALIKASKTPNINGKVFNIGFGESNSVENIVKISQNFSNYKIKTMIINNQKQDYDLLGGKGYADITKAKKILNWKPKYSLEEGLQKTYDWYQKNIPLYT